MELHKHFIKKRLKCFGAEFKVQISKVIKEFKKNSFDCHAEIKCSFSLKRIEKQLHSMNSLRLFETEVKIYFIFNLKFYIIFEFLSSGQSVLQFEETKNNFMCFRSLHLFNKQSCFVL